MSSLLITNGRLVTLDEANRFIDNGSVYIQGDKIVDAGDFRQPAAGLALAVPAVQAALEGGNLRLQSLVPVPASGHLFGSISRGAMTWVSIVLTSPPPGRDE